MDAPLTLVDGVIIILTALSALLAMARGFTREVLGILSVLGAGILAVYGAMPFAPLLLTVIDLKPLAKGLEIPVSNVALWVCGALLFVIFWIIFSVFTHKLSGKVAASAAGGADRGLGLIFGALRGLLILGFVYAIYGNFVPVSNRPVALNEAKLLGVLETSADTVRYFGKLILPAKISEGLQETASAPKAEDLKTKKASKEPEIKDSDMINLLIKQTEPLTENDAEANMRTEEKYKELEKVLKELEAQHIP